MPKRSTTKCSVEILSVGNELLLGNTVNTNASWLAANITARGGRVTRITTVPDEIDEIASAVRESLRRSPNYVIITGGLGPTFDDMTVKAVAKSIRQRMRIDPVAVAMIKEHYSSRLPDKQIDMTSPRLKMATIPMNGNAVPNPVGTAPAVHVKWGRSEIFCLPGVPGEAKAIFRNSISKEIQLKSRGTRFVEQWIRVTGIMESTLAPLVDQVMNRWPQLYIKSHPRGFEGEGRPNIELHISSFAFAREKAERNMAAAMKLLTRKLRRLNGRVYMST